MYETFYGLKERPFSLLPDPDYLYLSPKHMRALTLLEYGMMNQAGFSVICGDTGAGKTTLIRRLLTELGEDTTVGLITNTHKSFGELLSWVLIAFGLDGENKSKANMHQILIEFLIDQYAQNRHTVLIVDEAQNMTADTLEELRMLSNINSDKDQVLQVILAGQPALRETLRKPELMQFAQRIAVDYYLESLNRDETYEYIQHRLNVAGGNTDIFTEEACHEVYRYSGGTPRLINLLCDTALVYGFAEQTAIIEAPLIEDVVREQHRNSIVPTFNKPLNEESSRTQVSTAQKATHKKSNTKSQPVKLDTTSEEVIKEPIAQDEVEMASLKQKAASASNLSHHIGHIENQHSGAVHESTNISKSHSSPNQSPVSDEEVPVPPSKVTSIKKPTIKVVDESIEDGATSIKHAIPQSNAEEQPQPAQHRRQGDIHEAEEFKEQDPEPTVQPKSTRTESLEPAFDEEDTTERTPYKDVYPIVHIADEPKKNFNILVFGILGGMVLSMLMFMAAWFMFSNDPPSQISNTIQTPVDITSPVASAEEQARLANMERERDEAMAITEELKRERDAALAAAQKQEAIRSAEKRASEIISAQERKYATEMERVRQRAFEAEVAASKARERERIATEAAERARADASRAANASTQPTAVTTPPPVPHVEPERKAEATTTKAGSSTTEEADSRFSTNPCNSPSAKFLSTCKK